MSEQKIPIPAMLYNAAVGGHVTNSQQIIDENENKEQSQINSEVKQTLGQGGSVNSRIAAAVNTEKTRAEGVEATLDGRVDTLEEAVGTGGSVDSRIASAVATETTRAQTAEEQLRTLYNNLQQSQPIPVTSLPATGEAGKIYRLTGANSYADYMYAEGALTIPIKMAEYDNAIDNEPTVNSANLVKSGGVYNKVINKKYILISNVFNNDNITLHDGFIRLDNGSIYGSQTSYCYTDMLEVNKNVPVIISKIWTEQGVAGIACYDSNRDYLPDASISHNYWDESEPTTIDFSLLTNVKYVRFSTIKWTLENEYNNASVSLVIIDGDIFVKEQVSTIISDIDSIDKRIINNEINDNINNLNYQKRKLIFFDDFNGTTVDTSKWTIKNGYDGNSNLIYVSEDTISVKNSCIKLSLLLNTDQSINRKYLASFLSTIHKFCFKRGRIDIKMKCTKQNGQYFALWGISNAGKYGYASTINEVDIIESNSGFGMSSAVHITDTNGTQQHFSNNISAVHIDISKWHIYSVEYTDAYIIFRLDNRVVWIKDYTEVQTTLGFTPMNIILSNYAVEDVEALIGAYMLIDYVAVYSDEETNLNVELEEFEVYDTKTDTLIEDTITIDKSNGETMKNLYIKPQPSNASNCAFNIISSDSSIVSVPVEDEGCVFANTIGTSTLTIVSNSGNIEKTITCNVV